MEHKPADGVALSVQLPHDDAEALREFHENPFVFQLVELYARERGLDVEDVLYGQDEAWARAPQLGYSTIGEAAQAQMELNKSLRRTKP